MLAYIVNPAAVFRHVPIDHAVRKDKKILAVNAAAICRTPTRNLQANQAHGRIVRSPADKEDTVTAPAVDRDPADRCRVDRDGLAKLNLRIKINPPAAHRFRKCYRSAIGVINGGFAKGNLIVKDVNDIFRRRYHRRRRLNRLHLIVLISTKINHVINNPVVVQKVLLNFHVIVGTHIDRLRTVRQRIIVFRRIRKKRR